MIEEIQGKHPEATALEVWFQDEARVGQKGTLTRRWAPRGSRPRAIRDHRFKSAYLFGAVCPDRDLGIAVVLSRASSEAMDIMLAELSQAVVPGAHAAVLIDGAGYHIAKDLVVPANISLLPIPPYSPELNPQENIWQYLRQNKLSNIVSKDYDTFVQNSCDAWIWLMNLPDQVRSIASRDWAKQVSC